MRGDPFGWRGASNSERQQELRGHYPEEQSVMGMNLDAPKKNAMLISLDSGFAPDQRLP